MLLRRQYTLKLILWTTPAFLFIFILFNNNFPLKLQNSAGFELGLSWVEFEHLTTTPTLNGLFLWFQLRGIEYPDFVQSFKTLSIRIRTHDFSMRWKKPFYNLLRPKRKALFGPCFVAIQFSCVTNSGMKEKYFHHLCVLFILLLGPNISISSPIVSASTTRVFDKNFCTLSNSQNRNGK